MDVLMAMKREIIKLIVWASFGLSMMILSVLLSGCRTVYVPVESVHTEYKDRLRTDSIHIHDSIHVREKDDTIWLTRWRTEYRDRLKVDSIFIRDSIQIPFPVERELTRWEKVKMDIGGIAMGGLIALIIIFVIVLYTKRKKNQR